MKSGRRSSKSTLSLPRRCHFAANRTLKSVNQASRTNLQNGYESVEVYGLAKAFTLIINVDQSSLYISIGRSKTLSASTKVN